ncbi:4Fe-4S dicluster domain-containing protein [Roseiconus nitratireducens]|uniref:4Fe-4S dicluster domain-containing protein n=1 Tax=Roseiconus nitratireducens TaxID=2605748 RepID=A0A5M6DHD0_9BACT|nr:TAT-variant-translocated molybdopterin oxidoreductase [Roseiconus nitratireducens]KAA5546954.1 4Fe-4S dicluster domain-containing protein [Roseiconus nitratireducens]
MTQNESTASGKAPTYWRSIAELHGSEEFQNNYLHREFPVAASEFPEGVSRRRWMQLMGASLAMAGVAGCRYPEEIIAPFVIRPEGRVPGETYKRATNFELAGRVHNLLVSCFDGRPQHIEPNSDHPSGAGTDPYVQASVLALYDPDRSRGDDGPLLLREPDERKQESTWEQFLPVGRGAITRAADNGNGENFALLMSPTASPTLLRLVERLREKLPAAKITRFDGPGDDVMRTATKQMLGTESRQVLDLADAKVILSLGSDFLGCDSGALDAAKSFAESRNPLSDEDMSRLYVAEGGYTTTGAMADTRLAVRPGQMKAFLATLSRKVDAIQAGEADPPAQDELPFNHPDITDAERLSRFMECLAHDIAEAGDKAVVIVGDALGPELVSAGIAMNQKLGSLGTLQKFTPLPDAMDDLTSLSDLVDACKQGNIDTLMILGDNPVVSAPGDIDVPAAIEGAKLTIYLGEYDDETANLCNWSLPLAHPLESWSDCINAEGFYGVCQPQILPLMGGRTAAEVLALMLDEDVFDPMKLVRRTADQIAGGSLSEREWRQLLHDGYSDAIKVDAGTTEVVGQAPELPGEDIVVIGRDDISENDIEVIFTLADGVYDGRFANNGWLQELPQAITKLTWGNCAIMSPATAAIIPTDHGSYVTLRKDGKKIELPVFLVPGVAPGVVTASIGYGRTRAGVVGGHVDKEVDVVGFDVSPLRTSKSMMIAYQCEGRPNQTQYEFATTQDHWAIDDLGRAETQRRSYSLVREGTKKLLEKVPSFANEQPKAPHVPKVGKYGSLQYEPIAEIERDESLDFIPQWGMAIDLTKCIGCSACVVACQSENNIPIVGAEQVKNSREMHWLRIDRYFQGDENNADIVHQPVACVHCETAPCEQVCPVAATVHTDEGINAMAYNRCIGTRYCANNCPLKVRRFNYFNYNEDVGVGYGWSAFPGEIESANRKLQQLVLNPDVTVRGRGVMEKCTYCVQRVEKAKINARKDGGRPIRDGDVITACQAACPTKAIDFGNISDPESAVAKKHQDVRAYGILEQLNIKPRTEYLARVRNPHPRLMTEQQLHDLAVIESHHGEHGHDEAGEAGHDAHGEHDSGSGGEESHDSPESKAAGHDDH